MLSVNTGFGSTLMSICLILSCFFITAVSKLSAHTGSVLGGAASILIGSAGAGILWIANVTSNVSIPAKPSTIFVGVIESRGRKVLSLSDIVGDANALEGRDQPSIASDALLKLFSEEPIDLFQCPCHVASVINGSEGTAKARI